MFCSSRTDAGVHALSNVCHVDIERISKRRPGEVLPPHEPTVVQKAVNHFLQEFLFLSESIETVILWLSEDQSFWDDIEDGPRPLGPLGLQQFYLDMKFVICFASQGRFLSRNLQRVINEIISKAMTAFSATGMDPYSELPEDEWFDDICHEAMERLSGKPKAINGDRDLNSPTASVSAQSISSVRSHGSS